MPTQKKMKGLDRIELWSKEDVRRTPHVVEQIRAIAGPSYDSSTALLDRALEHATHVYLGILGELGIRCFFMVGWEQIAFTAGPPSQAVYLGLSAEPADDHEAQDVSDLFHRFVRDASHWETEHNQQLLLWGTTATPIVFVYLERLMTEVQPKRDGSYSAPYAEIAAAMRTQFYPHSAPDPNHHPFVLKQVATATRYSAREHQRLSQIEQKLGFDLFQRLGISEPDGDRLLFLCRLK